MRILVYPHAMEIGGSQLNAVELAGAVRDLGHEVTVYGGDGPLVERVLDLQLPYVRCNDGHIHPSPGRAYQLHDLAKQRHIDIIHTYEWPPAMEAYAARGLGARPGILASIMSMSVPTFLPSGLPVTLGTQQLRRQAHLRRRGPAYLLEPPVDTVANRHDLPRGADHGVGPRDAQFKVVIVCRLVPELKLEGILTAISAVGSMAPSIPIHLTIVGDGPARTAVQEAADGACRCAGVQCVTLAGELADPRPAYANADVCIGMGGSALKALAFGKPLIVQGEQGYFQLLTPANVGDFLDRGWYGRGESPSAGHASLRQLLRSLAADARWRAELGDFGRELVLRRYALTSLAHTVLETYIDVLELRQSSTRLALDGARAAVGLVRHSGGRRLRRRWTNVPEDDLNAAAS